MFLGVIICCRFSSVLHTDMIIIKLNTCIFKNVEEEEINPLPICTLKYSMYLTMHTKNKYIQNQNKETHKHFHLHTLIGANIYTKPHGYSGSFSAMESHEKKPFFSSSCLWFCFVYSVMESCSVRSGWRGTGLGGCANEVSMCRLSTG